jgi:formate dehydrogenase iron-sulfur subunit
VLLEPVAIPSLRSPETLLEQMLREQHEPQKSRTAVELFSEEFDRGAKNLTVRTGRYRDLLPATPPSSGQQYAFEVDLDRCSGCKACVTACHSLNGLDETETWRDVGLLVGGTRSLPVLQHVTAACHHCLEPACMSACPVNAYEKDPLTGIVKHLDDQCFGCQYCTLACPYDVPKYHAAKGIVRKCDMCSSRLAVGEAPACVQACPHQAIAIRTVDVQQVIEDAEAAVFLPGAPDVHISLPTTTYKTKKPFPKNLLPADYFRVVKQHTHWPLVVMLVLTQLSVGAFTVGVLLDEFVEPRLIAPLRPWLAANALVFGLLALAASTFHLGRPHLAFRAVLGLKHSWLSREIVAFGVFAGLATLYSGAIYLTRQSAPNIVGGAYETQNWLRWLGFSVSGSGLFAVFCSVMIYVFTQRECWSFTRVGVRFALTAAILGIAVIWLSVLLMMFTRTAPELDEMIQRNGAFVCYAMIAFAGAKLIWDAAIFRHLLYRQMTSLKRSAILMTRELSNLTLARFAVGILGGIIFPAILLTSLSSATAPGTLPKFVILTGMQFLACVVGELLERALFFSACAAPRMPGAIR